MQFCRPLPRRQMEHLCMKKDDMSTQMVHTFFAAGKSYEKNIFPRSWLTESVDMPFEDGVFPVSRYYDALLTRLYGDYHQLPAPGDRKCKEHAAILDLEHSYEAYLETQKEMTFETYTRSIR